MTEKDSKRMKKLPNGWVLVNFSEVVTIISTTGKKVKQRDYLSDGVLPVIDQGHLLVGGYTDNLEKQVECELPVVIFGDHTKALKYVDFHFAPGADGIKVIKPSKIFNPKAFFYFLNTLDLPDRGYSRHFQFLRKETLPLAPLPEQHRIVDAIETQFTRLDAAVAALQRAKTNLARYKAAVLKTACEGRLVPTEAALHPPPPRRGETFRAPPKKTMNVRTAHPPSQSNLPDGECLAPTVSPPPHGQGEGETFPPSPDTAAGDARMQLSDRHRPDGQGEAFPPSPDSASGDARMQLSDRHRPDGQGKAFPPSPDTASGRARLQLLDCHGSDRQGEAFPPSPDTASGRARLQLSDRQGSNGECLAPTPMYEPADVLLRRILAERRARWEQDRWQYEIERAKKKAAQAERKAKGLPYYIRDLEPEDWEAIPEADYAPYLPKNDKWKQKYKEPEEPDTSALPALPEGWAYTFIKAVLSTKRPGMKTGPFGSLLKKHEHQTKGVPVLGIENIGTDGYKPGNKIFITEQKAEQLSAYDVQPEDILISRSGTVGEVCIVPESVGQARFSTNLMRIILEQDGMLPKFFRFLFNGSPFVLNQVSKLCSGSTRDFLNQKILNSIIFPLPPLAEQHRIVEEVERRLSVVAEVEAAVDANLARAARLRQAILKRAFAGRLVPQNPDDEPASALLARIRAES